MNMRVPIAKARPGRPSKEQAEERQQELLDHALAQFMLVGYHAATMDGIATSFGASKATLYRHYGSKSGLLRAAMERTAPRLLRLLKKVDANLARAPSDVLKEFGEVIQDYHANAKVQALLRAIIEAREELNLFLDEAETLRTIALAPIADYLRLLESNKQASFVDAAMAASCFCEMCSGGLNAFLSRAPARAERTRRLDFAINLFLQGIGPRLRGIRSRGPRL